MSTRKVVALGAVGIALLVAASAAVLVWLDRAPAPAAIAPPADAPAPAVVPAVAPPPAAEPEPLISPQRIGARPRAASSVAWELVPQAAKVSELGPGLAAPVSAAVRAARAKMDSCFEEDTRLQAQRPAPRYDPEDPPRGPAVLILRLESRQDALDVIDTELESLGTSTRELVDCARHVLKGWPIDAPGARPGSRYRLTYVLM